MSRSNFDRESESVLERKGLFSGAGQNLTGSHVARYKAENRQYAERMEGIAEFDPLEDLALADNGTWRWNSNKQEMQEFVRRYFVSRREDG